MQEKIKKANRIIIKIGTSNITKNNRLDIKWIREKVSEIAELKNKGKKIVLISSGALAAGMEIEKLHKRPSNLLKWQLLAGKGQPLLYEKYRSFFEEHGIQTAHVLLTHHNFKTKEEEQNIKDVLNSYLKEGTIPIINTNDVVTKEEIMPVNSHGSFTDNDELAALVSNALNINLLLILTDVEGLYTRDPKKNDKVMLIKLVKKINKDTEEMASKETIGGKGGMYSKVMAAKKVAEKGTITIVANGVYNLDDILNNKVDRTVFLG